MSAAVLDAWNLAEDAEALRAILPCNGCVRWARELVARRPFASEEALMKASDAVWAGLDAASWGEAFRSHPRLGERQAEAASEQSLAWSAAEQSSVTAAEAEARSALTEANRAYEGRFGMIFLLCATGKTTADVLAILQQRLGNNRETEWREAGEQQRRITQLRLRLWLGLAPARCEDV